MVELKKSGLVFSRSLHQIAKISNLKGEKANKHGFLSNFYFSDIWLLSVNSFVTNNTEFATNVEKKIDFQFVFVTVTFYSHSQLDVDSKGGLKMFVTNRLSQPIISNMHIKDTVMRLEKSILNISWIDQAIYTHGVSTPISHTPMSSQTSSEVHHESSNAIHNQIKKAKDDSWQALKCPNADGKLVSFWRRPTESDLNYRSPFEDVGPNPKYVTFEPDVGGWNNIRMQMETVLVFAAATGRTLVLPPDQPLYLLNKGKGHENAHSFADFFPFDRIAERVPVISMAEFMAREALTGHMKINGTIAYPPGNKSEFLGTDRDDRNKMWRYLREAASCPPWKCMEEFLVVPPGPGVNVSLLSDANEYDRRRDVFAAKRKPVYYNDHWQRQAVVHFISLPGSGYRLLAHFYTFIHFEDPAMDRLHKRFVSSTLLHYTSPSLSSHKPHLT
eukprot:gene2518-4897_t